VDLLFITNVLTSSPREQASLASLFEDEDLGALDAILASDPLLAAVLENDGIVQISPELYFYVVTRHVLAQFSVRDRRVVDYIAGTLTQFSRSGTLSRRPGSPAGDFSYQVDFLQALEKAGSYERFYLYVSSGNQFLILTGLFPQFIERRERDNGAPGLDFYESAAGGAFRSAGEHPLADEFDLREVYERLTGSIHAARLALNRLADEYLVLAS
jgi:hypothetical protein